MAKISRQMRQHANNERDLKLSFEKILIPQLQKVFAKFMRGFRSEFKATANVLNAHSISPVLNDILTTAYKRTSAAFLKNFTIFRRKSIKQEITPEERNTATEAAILAFILASVPEQTRFIINTTNKQLAAKIEEIVTTAAQTGSPLNVDQIADLAFEQYNVVLGSRIDLIATFETQNIAEQTKSIAATQRSIVGIGAEPSGVPASQRVSTKIWVAILDRKTRISHALADGQERNINEPFDVMGQKLKRPGDTSLGATAANVMECRCSVIYS